MLLRETTFGRIAVAEATTEYIERVSPLKIIVFVKAVPTYIADPRVSPVPDRVAGKFGPLVMNESDEYALEHALALREEFGGEVTVLSVGSAASEPVLARAFARGADRVVRIDADLADGDNTAMALAAAARHLGFDLILTGVESSDNMASRVGITVADRLGIPFAYSVREIKRGETPDTMAVAKELGGGVTQIVAVSLPAMFCLQACSIPLTYTSVAKLIQSRSKTVECLDMHDLGLDEQITREVSLSIVDVFRARKSRAQIIDGTPDEIASALIREIKKVV